MSDADISYVVGVKKANHLRRHVLESAKYTIDVLKDKREVMDLRQRQTDKVVELRGLIRDLESLFGQLKAHIPEKKTPASLKKEIKKSKKPVPEPVVEEPQEHIVPSETDLTEVKGIGPSRVTKLLEIGVHSVEDLAQVNPSALQKADISYGLAEKLIDRARELVPSPSSGDRALSEMDILEQKLSAIESKLNNL